MIEKVCLNLVLAKCILTCMYCAKRYFYNCNLRSLGILTNEVNCTVPTRLKACQDKGSLAMEARYSGIRVCQLFVEANMQLQGNNLLRVL